MSPADVQLAREHRQPDEDAVTRDFIDFLKAASKRRHPHGTVRRFNQPRHAGCVEAEFTVSDGLADELRVGLFAEPRAYAAHLRFASASPGTDRDKDIRGLSIKLEAVSGRNLTAGATTQDFVLNSHPVMVAPDTRAFLDLLRSVEAGGIRRIWYFLTHLQSARIGVAARSHPTCHLDIAYWSTTPYLFGDGRAVKYMVRPTSSRTSELPDPLTDDYLRHAMMRHLAETEASFDFMVQFQTDPTRMPIEDATTDWDPVESPFVRVAQLCIPPQEFDSVDRLARCEAVTFNPWCCLAEHRPLGNMNRARRHIYPELARFRGERSASVG